MELLQPFRKAFGGAGWQEVQQESPVYVPLAAKRANLILERIKHSIISWSKEVIIPSYLALVQPHLEYRVLFWAPPFKKNGKVQEHTQRVPLDKVLTGMSSEKKLRRLGLSNWERWRLRGDLSALRFPEEMLICRYCSPLPGTQRQDTWKMVHLSWGAQTWWEETFLYQQGVKLCNRPLGEVVDACLSVLKRYLDSALKDTLYLFISPEVITQLDYETDVGPF